MKNMKPRGTNFRKSLLVISVLAALVACTENIDMSNRYTFTEYTVYSYLTEGRQAERFTEYVKLINEVKISSKSESTVAKLLSARGHFTCFAPSNAAIQLYLEDLYNKGILTEPTWDGFKTQKDKDSIKQVIVYNSIIDGGDDLWFETSNFPTNDNDEFSVANMNDRKLSVVYGSINPDSIYINGDAPMDMNIRNIEAINGCVHQMLGVIAPSNDTTKDYLLKWANEGGSEFVVTAKLLLVCGFGDTLSKVRDEVWEELYLDGKVVDLPEHRTEHNPGPLPPHRKYGFTIFAEPDAIWEAALGKTAMDITVEDVMGYLDRVGAYPSATRDANYKSKDNLVNQFISYHVLPEGISRDKLVLHWNEPGYNYSTSTSYSIPVMEYYQTLGKRRLIKIFQSRESNEQSVSSDGIFLNRFPVLRNGRGMYSVDNLDVNDYHESGQFKGLSGESMSMDENEGVEILKTPVFTTINGYFYPISKMLYCTENICTQLQRERMRFDFTAMFPEFMNNNLRGLKTRYTELGKNRGFPYNYNYIAGIDIHEGTNFYYLPGRGDAWKNYQGDEFNITGKYEFIMQLPPVPKAGHYEIRYGLNVNQERSMTQVYFGENKENLPAMGIPLDLRMGGEYRYLSGGNQTSIVGWEKDVEDQATNDEIDKKMRNNGFMKGSNSYTQAYGSNTTLRTASEVIRRIIVSADMDPNKTYYLKFKSVLDDEQKQCYMDYIEYCAKEVYDNPEESEDIW